MGQTAGKVISSLGFEKVWNVANSFKRYFKIVRTIIETKSSLIPLDLKNTGLLR